MKSIKLKILVPAVAIMFISLMVVGCISVYENYVSTVDSLEQTMTEAVRIAANQVDAKLNGYKMLVSEISSDSEIIDYDNQELIEEFREIEKTNGFTKVGRTDVAGISVEDGVNISDREYIRQVKETGKPYVSTPIISKDDGSMNIFVAAPITKNGKFDGVFFAGLDANFLIDIVLNIHIGESGNASIIDKNGTTIAYQDLQTVLDGYNTQVEAKKDPKLERLAALEREAMSGKTGFGDYSYGGADKFMAYTSIPNTDGWAIYVSVARSEFMDSTNRSIYIIIIALIVSTLIASLLIFNVARKISDPIVKCVDRIIMLAQGDLSTEVPKIESKDETRRLSDATETIVHTMSEIINDISWGLEEMSKGDFTIDSRVKELYVGDFKRIAVSMYGIMDRLTETIRQIGVSADQVAGGSEQVSAGAQALSQGATEQASSVEELAATINEISVQVRDNADNARLASDEAGRIGDEINVSKEKMEQMIAAMSKISDGSKEIGKIIKTIEDIAFQTNILALNAAVEAARAGAAGKGFAVVADEVRSLAGKSSEASKNTSALIENSIKSVEDGSLIANDTAKSMMEVVESVQQIIGTIDKISGASVEQAESISQVTMGVDQISSVVQTNSATAEESAAASQELSAQAQMLKDMVGNFKLKEADRAS